MFFYFGFVYFFLENGLVTKDKIAFSKKWKFETSDEIKKGMKKLWTPNHWNEFLNLLIDRKLIK